MKYLNAVEAADLLRVTPRTMETKASTGELRAYRLGTNGRQWLFTEEDLHKALVPNNKRKHNV